MDLLAPDMWENAVLLCHTWVWICHAYGGSSTQHSQRPAKVDYGLCIDDIDLIFSRAFSCI